MKKNIYYLSVVCLVLFSCKDEKKINTEENYKKNFNVEIDVITQTPDDFAVYYTEDKTNNFPPEAAVWAGVKGESKEEKIFFDLPPQIIPTNIRLDFGIKKDYKDIVIKNIKLSFYSKNFNIKGSELLNYFIVNKYLQTTIDNVKGTITLHIIDPSNIDGSYYYPRQELIDKLAEMTK
jgi:hypothetical protein